MRSGTPDSQRGIRLDVECAEVAPQAGINRLVDRERRDSRAGDQFERRLRSRPRPVHVRDSSHQAIAPRRLDRQRIDDIADVRIWRKVDGPAGLARHVRDLAHLQKTKEALLSSENNLRLANNKAEDLSIKRLTKNAPAVRAMFDDLKAGEDA